MRITPENLAIMVTPGVPVNVTLRAKDGSESAYTIIPYIRPSVGVDDPATDEILALLLALANVSFGVTAKEIAARGRRFPVMRVRHAICYAAHALGCTYQSIGRILNRTHATILHGCKKHRERMVGDKPLKDTTDSLILAVRKKEVENGKAKR